MKLCQRVETPQHADGEEHGTSTVPQNLGHYTGGWVVSVTWSGSSIAFTNSKQWPAFSMIVVARLGQSPFSPSLAFTLLELDLYYASSLSQQENDNWCHCDRYKTNNIPNILKLLQCLG